MHVILCKSLNLGPLGKSLSLLGKPTVCIMSSDLWSLCTLNLNLLQLVTEKGSLHRQGLWANWISASFYFGTEEDPPARLFLWKAEMRSKGHRGVRWVLPLGRVSERRKGHFWKSEQSILTEHRSQQMWPSIWWRSLLLSIIGVSKAWHSFPEIRLPWGLGFVNIWTQIAGIV